MIKPEDLPEVQEEVRGAAELGARALRRDHAQPHRAGRNWGAGGEGAIGRE